MTEADNVVWRKSSTSKFFLFGVPKFGTSILIGFADIALAALYIEAFQVTPFLVGFALAMGKLTIAASQFFFGWISDAKYTRWGRRKPYLIILSPILGVSFFFLLLPSLMININDKAAVFLWLLILYQIFNISYGVTSPYGSWMVEQFSNDERPRASQYQNTIGMLGSGVMSVFAIIILTGVITQIQNNPNVIPFEYSLSVLIFGIIPVILFYLVTFLMPTEPHFKIDSNIFQNLTVIVKNKNYLFVNGMMGIASIAWIMVGTLLLQYMQVVLVFSQTTYTIVAALFLIGILAFLYIWRKLVHKLGKKQSILYIFLVAIIFLPFSLIGLIPSGFLFIFGLIFVVGLGGCLAGWYLIPAIAIADIAEDDERKTGELKAGIYTGFPSIILNLFQSVGLLIMGTILELPAVGTSTFSLGYVIWGPVCSLILIGAYLYTRKFVQLDFEWEKKDN